MNLDTLIVETLNQFARTVPTFDVLIVKVTRTYLFKGGVMMLFIWWGWFRKSANPDKDRASLMAVLMAALTSLVAARTLAWLLPNRLRPVHDAAVDMILPIGQAPGALTGWSSFPSDHAALFGCLASGLFLISRKAGIFATAYAVVVIMLPRIYMGLHYPSDLLVGYALGALCVWSASRELAMNRVVAPVYDWCMDRPGFWYPLFFLLSVQIVTLFDEIRQFASLLYLIGLRFYYNYDGIMQMN
jgi:undecaprenyl-diphosphatase